MVCGLSQNKTTFYFNVIKKFVLLSSKYIIAVFCGLFKGFYLAMQWM